MAGEANKAIVSRTYDAINANRLSVVDEVFAVDFRNHAVPPGMPSDREGIKLALTTLRTAFPDFHDTVEELIADGDRVVARLTTRGTHLGDFFGIPPTGKTVTWTAVDIFRIANGQIAEYWLIADNLGLLQQLRGG